MILEVCLTFLLVFLFFWLTKKPENYPPGPFCFPILGNIQVLSQLKIVKFYFLLWDRLSKIYGPLVGLKFFNDRVIIVSGSLVKKLYNIEELNGRPDGFFFRIRSFNKRLGVVFTDGELWENQRLFSVKTLKNLGFGKSSMIEHIECEAEELIKHLSKKSGEEIMVQDKNNNIFDISVMNVMWKILRGKRFELDDEIVIGLMESIHKCFQVIDMSGGVLNHVPFVRHFFPDASGFRPLVNSVKVLWDFLKENISEVLKSYDPTLKPQNFIEYYCRELLNQTSSESFFSQEQLLALCVDFFQAGSETTSNTLSFAILYMLHFPDVMSKVQDELHKVVGDRMPKLIDRQNLKYSEAVICEIQRLSNVAPLGIAHRALNSFKVGKFTVPKNSLILFNLYSLHMDENYWHDPKQFKPERFLKDGNLIHHENFIPFGLGKRRCVGENLAKSSLFLLFTSLMHVFKMEAVGELPDLKGKDGITLSPHPFKIKLTRKRIFIQNY